MKKKMICWIAYAAIWLLQRTWQMIHLNPEMRDRGIAQSHNGSICFACWHHSTLTSMLSVAFRRFVVLVSKSYDGDIIAYINSKFGVGSARGSSSRDGKGGMTALLNYVEHGYEVGFTVDGPRGPRHQVKPGVIALAAKTGIPIVPTASCGKRFWSFNKSWDRFRLPKFFTKVYVVYGSPLMVKADPSPEEFADYQNQLAQSLLKLEDQLAQLVDEPYRDYFADRLISSPSTEA